MDEQCIECGHVYDIHHLKDGLCYLCSDLEFYNVDNESYITCDCEVEQCKMIEGECKNLAYR